MNILGVIDIPFDPTTSLEAAGTAISGYIADPYLLFVLVLAVGVLWGFTRKAAKAR